MFRSFLILGIIVCYAHIFAQKQVKTTVNIDSVYALGMESLYQTENVRAGIRHFEMVVQLDSSHANAWYHLGVCQQAIGRPLFALESYTRALHYKPTQGDWYAKRAALRENQMNSNDWYENHSIILDYNFAIVYEPNNPEYWMRRGVCKVHTFSVYLDATGLTGKVLDKTKIAMDIPYAMDCCIDFQKATALNPKIAAKADNYCSAYDFFYTEGFRLQHQENLNNESR